MSLMSLNVARRLATRQAFRPIAAQPMRRASTSAKEATKKDPELLVLLAWMTAGFSLAGWYLGRTPTATSTKDKGNVRLVDSAMPWNAKEQEDEEKTYKYQYHPGGDVTQPLQNAPNALNEVVIPNVSLPEGLHEMFNKYGKDD